MCDNRAPTIVLTLTVDSRTYTERFPFDDHPERFDANAMTALRDSVQKFVESHRVSTDAPWDYSIKGICANCNKDVFDDEVTGIFDMPGYKRDTANDPRYPEPYVVLGIVVIKAVKDQIMENALLGFLLSLSR